MTTTATTAATRRRIRRRPVSFGNPALGTYHGVVYTAQQQAKNSDDNTTDARRHQRGRREQQLPRVIEEEGGEGDDAARVESTITTTTDRYRGPVVAMVDVPPEQVPDGILNFARAHRHDICHVRIVIAENEEDGSERDEEEEGVTDDGVDVISGNNNISNDNESNNARAGGDDVQRQHQQPSRGKAEHDGSSHTSSSTSRTYVVLIELSTAEAAAALVDDLHDRPYTILDEDVRAQVYHVVELRGDDGVHLMSPFFAPDAPSSVVAAAAVGGGAAGGGGGVSSTASTLGPAIEDTNYHCAVCLEHIDLHMNNNIHNNNDDDDAGSSPSSQSEERATTTRGGDSILTTVCNHSFHLTCLLKWQDSPCPVCRYDHAGLNDLDAGTLLSQCHVCSSTQHNYVCLICGVVSCIGVGAGGASGGASVIGDGSSSSRPCQQQSSHGNRIAAAAAAGGVLTTAAVAATGAIEEERSLLSQQRRSVSHARQHYDESLHAYALDTETQHVWDFAGQGYVHRLLQNKEDGKLVEVHDPASTSQERSVQPGLSEAQEGEVVHRKLEGFAGQYYTLLKSQLEQQRIYYEGRVAEIRREHDQTTHRIKKRPADLIAALKQERQQLSQRTHSLTERCRKFREDVTFLTSMNESLTANREPLQRQLAVAQQERVDAQRRVYEEAIPALEEKVTKLMLQLENEATGQQHPTTAEQQTSATSDNK